MAIADPHFMGLLSSLSTAAAMVWLGLRYQRLELRSRSRRCPACGRHPCACRAE